MRQVAAVLFDLDGTLLDRESSLLKFAGSQYDRFYRDLSVINKEDYINRFIELDSRGYVWKDKVYNSLLKEFNLRGMTCEVLLEDYMTNFKYTCIGFPHLHEVLVSLQQMGLKLGLISNGKTRFQMDNVKALGIEGFFDCILISEEVRLSKPDPLIFQKALEKLGVSAAQSIYVGDHPEKDVSASRKIGMVGVWKRDDYWQNADADYIIENLNNLLSIISEGAMLHGKF
ncbi:HAD family hydrolase [Mesobacillus jeotgali]|uniref:HAD family hydrolase n=1 Tax=Mesobacillus jeotgali TaxID=129985 RepID=UPI0009A7082D|nr:HAD family hydrolase [Mesobacillus jeotgali]